MVKDCLDRLSFPSRNLFSFYRDWHKAKFGHVPWAFKCERCGRWHIANSPSGADRAEKALKRERCVSTRELHLQMCRVLGISLEELQTRTDLSKITLTGCPGAEVVTLGPSLTKKPWE